MARQKLTVQKREVSGRKVKQLRKKEIVPANVYGKKIKSSPVQLNLKDFARVYGEVGETGLIDLIVEGEKETRPVLIHNVQRDPVKRTPLHVDFHQIVLTEKVKAAIPIELVGTSPADIQKVGILVKVIPEIEVEALPTDLPDSLPVDTSKLEKVDDFVSVKDLKVDRSRVELRIDESQIVAKIEPLAKEEVVTPPPITEAPVEGVAPLEEVQPVAEGGEEVKKSEEKPQEQK
jgi:large subunit ribosomal protein L25